MFNKQDLLSDDLVLFEQYRLSNLLSSFESFTEVIRLEIFCLLFLFKSVKERRN